MKHKEAVIINKLSVYSTLLKQRFEKFIATLWHYVFLLQLVKFIS